MTGNSVVLCFVDGANVNSYHAEVINDKNSTYGITYSSSGQADNLLKAECTLPKNTEVGILVIKGEILQIIHPS